MTEKGYFERATPKIDRDTCIDCGRCADVCGGQPLVVTDGKVEVDPDADLGCLACGQCMLVCPTGSMSVSGRGLSKDDVFELDKSPVRADIDQIEGLLTSRRSIRRFTDKEVDRALVERIVRVASTAPMGIPPSEVGIVILHGPTKVRELQKDTMDAMGRTLKVLNPFTLTLFRPFMKRATYEGMKEFVLPMGEIMRQERDKGNDTLLYGAPVALMFHTSTYADPADPFIAATYAMIAAEAAGLGTCMIGLVGPFMERDRKMMAKYGIPKGNKPALVLLMGYPVLRFKKGVRRRFASVSFME
jgi:nitroreductase/NAD-dependent dihydropyrimidine dehydrogenase PreA subunit